MDTPTVPLSDQITEVRREIAQRERVYSRWVEQSRMSQRDADRQIGRMRAVLATLQGLESGSRLL